jgi:outer membrane lipoprotein-sorting protein
MRSGLRLAACGLRLSLLLVAACPKPQTIAGPAPEATALYAEAQAAHRQPETLTCDAKAVVDAPENAGRYALHISVKRPASVRIEALTPLGDPAAVLVADQGRFALLDLRNNVFYRGPATPQNLSRLIPAPLTADQLVALVTGAIPEGGDPLSAKRDDDGYVLGLSKELVWLGNDMRVRRLERDGWAVTLDDHDDGVPRSIHLEAPRANTKVDLRLRNVATGKSPPETAFRLTPPAGIRVEDLQ